VKDEQIEPLELRRALIHFLASFPHRKSAASAGRTAFESEERAGAGVFRQRCESCHAARRFSDEPATHVGFDQWEPHVFAGDLVWASSDYQKTGIEPYVSEKGARVPSLRRLSRKRPYFTNGSSPTLADVVARVRFADGRTWHDEKRAAPGATALSPSEQSSLVAFLELL
jgi:cytochrome c peroxidase